MQIPKMKRECYEPKYATVKGTVVFHSLEVLVLRQEIDHTEFFLGLKRRDIHAQPNMDFTPGSWVEVRLKIRGREEELERKGMEKVAGLKRSIVDGISKAYDAMEQKGLEDEEDLDRPTTTTTAPGKREVEALDEGVLKDGRKVPVMRYGTPPGLEAEDEIESMAERFKEFKDPMSEPVVKKVRSKYRFDGVSVVPDDRSASGMAPGKQVKAKIYDDLPTAPKNNVQEGKARLSLLPMDILKRYLVPAYEEGVIKYRRESWRQGFLVSDLADAALRHIEEFYWQGKTVDESSSTKKHPLAGAVFCLLSILHTMEVRPDLDDRPCNMRWSAVEKGESNGCEG